MDETVLVTGGTGFVGSYVVERLIEAGEDVVVFDLSMRTEILEKLGVAGPVTVEQGDITDPTAVTRSIRDHDVTHVIHLAALLTNSVEADPRSGLEVNILGTNNVFEAARLFDDQIERVAWASSAAVYAPPAKYDTDWVTEADLVSPDTLYGATKAYNEHQARTYSEEFGISQVALRPTVAYGPYREAGGSAFLTQMIEEPAIGKPYNVKYGDQVIDWHHVRDIAQAFHLAAFTPESDLTQRIYNVRGELATVSEAAAVIRNLIADADLTVSEDGELPWTQTLDMQKAKSDLGYEPEYDLETGFRQYINTVRDDHGLDPI